MASPLLRAPVFGVELLEDRLTPAKVFAVGADAGAGPHVTAWNMDGTLRFSFYAYDPSFAGGVRVATGDVNGDGNGDIITIPGPGAPPHVKVFSGVDLTLLASFYAFDPALTNRGGYIDAADANADGRADIFVVTTIPGHNYNSFIRVYDGITLGLYSNFQVAAVFNVEGTIGAGDYDRDGRADVYLAQPVAYAGNPGSVYQADVQIFNTAGTLLGSRLFWQIVYPDPYGGYQFALQGRRTISVGDMTGDGVPDIVLSSGAQVIAANGANGQILYNGLPVGPTEARVGLKDANNDGRVDLIAGSGYGTTSRVTVRDVLTGAVYLDFSPFPAFGGGVFVG